MYTPIEVLKKYWKHSAFIPPQEEIISRVLENNHVVALLPTGAGKSVCYQIPALIRPGVCLVISPLIALMNDQVLSLKEKGIKAIALTSALSFDETIDAFDNLKYGGYKFLYISPEKLQSDFIQQKIRELDINLIAIDEAHCISEWGHDFRPAYLKILPVINMLEKVPVIALTATATSRVLSDITSYLDIADALIIKRSLIRNNLSLNVSNTEDTYRFLKELLGNNRSPAILYANSRKKVQEVSFFLNGQHIRSSYYHGGLGKSEKQKAYEHWMSEKTPVMVATTAFGMGIDKDNVNLIVHIDLPLSLENYIQEIGRAGRNGATAAAYLLNSSFARHSLEKRLQNELFDREKVKAVYRDLNRYYSIAHGEIPEAALEFDLQNFCRQYSLNLSNTYAILKFLENEGVLVFDENPNKQSTVKCTANPDAVLRYIEDNKAEPLHAILRSYGGLFDQSIAINEALIAQKLSMSRAELKAEIIKYVADGILEYHNMESATGLKLLLPREDKSLINRISGNIAQYNKVKMEKVEAVVGFINNRDVCRNKLLAEYFGESPGDDCGTCDVCWNKSRKKNVRDVRTLQAEIIRLIAAHGQLSSKEMEPLVPVSVEALTTALQLLLDTGKITLNSHYKFECKPS